MEVSHLKYYLINFCVNMCKALFFFVVVFNFLIELMYKMFR